MRYTDRAEVELKCVNPFCDITQSPFYQPEVHAIETSAGETLAYNEECPICDEPGEELREAVR